jgi:hypothetical protein
LEQGDSSRAAGKREPSGFSSLCGEGGASWLPVPSPRRRKRGPSGFLASNGNPLAEKS